MSNEGDALIRELEEEVRREKLAKIWQQYGTYILAVVALIIAGVGGGQYWMHAKRQAAEAAGTRFVEAQTLAADGKADEARKAFEQIAKSGPGAYGTLADMRLAGEAISAGKPEEGLRRLEQIARDGSTDPMISDYAALQVAALKLGTPGWTEVANRINDLSKASSPWRYSALELKGLAAYRSGDFGAAREAFEPLLSDPGAPASIRARAEMLMSLITTRELATGKPADAGARN